jgi:hypothetical protein
MKLDPDCHSFYGGENTGRGIPYVPYGAGATPLSLGA